jgi:hypothetical protein
MMILCFICMEDLTASHSAFNSVTFERNVQSGRVSSTSEFLFSILYCYCSQRNDDYDDCGSEAESR